MTITMMDLIPFLTTITESLKKRKKFLKMKISFQIKEQYEKEKRKDLRETVISLRQTPSPIEQETERRGNCPRKRWKLSSKLQLNKRVT